MQPTGSLQVATCKIEINMEHLECCTIVIVVPLLSVMKDQVRGYLA